MTWTRLPQRAKRPKMGVKVSSKIACEPHKRWVRGFACICAGHERFKCEGRMEAHHQRTVGAGGGDEQVVPLCAFHHALLDSPGWSQKRLEAECGVDFEKVAEGLWRISPAGIRYRKALEAA